MNSIGCNNIKKNDQTEINLIFLLLKLCSVKVCILEQFLNSGLNPIPKFKQLKDKPKTKPELLNK